MLPDAGSQAQAKSHRTANAIAASDVSAVATTVVAPADTRANTMATRMKSLRMIAPPFPCALMARDPALHCDRNHAVSDLAHEPEGARARYGGLARRRFPLDPQRLK